MLELRDIHIRYGPLPALRGLSLRVKPGTIVGLTGPNGAGKSSTLRAIAGLQPVSAGRILWNGHDITRLPCHKREGIALVPEGRILARTLTVEETLRLGAGRSGRRERAVAREKVLALFPSLAERLSQKAGTLSGGEAQMLAIGRALMAAPRLLLLDEPTQGLSVAMARRVFETLPLLRADGIAVLLADQDFRAASSTADQMLFLESGTIRAQPQPTEETEFTS